METKSQSTKRTQAISDKYLQYVLDSIYPTSYNDEEGEQEIMHFNDKEKLQYLYDHFIDEYWYKNNQKRYGSEHIGFCEWIKGFPSCFNIEFENYKILELAKSMGSLTSMATEKQEDKILENYFDFITAKVFRLFRQYKIV